jgi:hypothetical protein
LDHDEKPGVDTSTDTVLEFTSSVKASMDVSGEKKEVTVPVALATAMDAWFAVYSAT